tara:strand:+ start:106 stop:492 length:387 start_codon:yes stop_codon:yes gene_type:complete
MSKKIKVSSNKSFGIVFSIFFLFISIYLFLNEYPTYYWSLFVSFIFLLLGLMNSKILSPLNLLWFKFGLLLGKIVSPFVMGIIFFVVVTPISILLKIFGKDVLNLKFNNNKTYWIEKNGPKSNMKKQF